MVELALSVLVDATMEELSSFKVGIDDLMYLMASQKPLQSCGFRRLKCVNFASLNFDTSLFRAVYIDPIVLGCR